MKTSSLQERRAAKVNLTLASRTRTEAKYEHGRLDKQEAPGERACQGRAEQTSELTREGRLLLHDSVELLEVKVERGKSGVPEYRPSLDLERCKKLISQSKQDTLLK